MLIKYFSGQNLIDCSIILNIRLLGEARITQYRPHSKGRDLTLVIYLTRFS